MEKIKLSQTEIIAVCKATEDVVVHLGVPNWSYKLLQAIVNAVNEKKPAGLNDRILFQYLLSCSDTKLLELLMKIDEYWGRDYTNQELSGFISPKEKLSEIRTRKKLSQKPFKYNINGMSLVEFLMFSQTMGNNYILYLDDCSGDNYVIDHLITWSVNKNNIGKLLKELSSSEQPFKIFKLEKVKRSVTN